MSAALIRCSVGALRFFAAADPAEPDSAGGHMNGIGSIESRQGCGIDLRWEYPLDTGSRHLGP